MTTEGQIGGYMCFLTADGQPVKGKSIPTRKRAFVILFLACAAMWYGYSWWELLADKAPAVQGIDP